MVRTAAYIGLALWALLAWVAPAEASGSHCGCAKGERLEVSHKTLKQLDLALSDKCSCKDASECTCKKGQCQCKNCGAHTFEQVFDALRKPVTPLVLPETAVLDARAGILI